jgi:hypothetical protein
VLSAAQTYMEFRKLNAKSRTKFPHNYSSATVDNFETKSVATSDGQTHNIHGVNLEIASILGRRPSDFRFFSKVFKPSSASLFEGKRKCKRKSETKYRFYFQEVSKDCVF